MSKFLEIMDQIQGSRTQAELAHEMGVSEAAISLAKSGKRQREPEKSFIAALLRVADADQAQELLEVLGMDVEQLRAAILASLGVATATVTATVGGNGSGDETEGKETE